MGAGATAVYHANHYDGTGATALTPEALAAYNAAEQERIRQEELFAELERDWYENEDSPAQTEEAEDDWDDLFGEEQIIEEEQTVEKYDGLRYHEDGTIVVTDDWTQIEHPHIQPNYQPNAVIETVSQKGMQHDRTYYDRDGIFMRQISNGPHGNRKNHPFGKNGEHAHDIVWENGKIVSRFPRELTEEERRENRDIL